MMRAIVLTEYGGPEVLRLQDVPVPEYGADEIRVDVAYTALNRADLLQRMGGYPPPEPAPPWEIPGLEFAGIVEAVGSRVTRWRPGDKVFGLLPGGGYAEKVVTHADMALPVPAALTLAQAAGVAEVFMTAYDALIHRAGLRSGERVLVHAGGSGVGSAAIQLARAFGATVYATVGTPEKVAGVEQLGARAIHYPTTDFVRVIEEATGGGGVHVILDFVGSPYLARNMQAAAVTGRIVQIGLLGGTRTEIDLNVLLRKRLTLVGTALRTRTLAEKLTLTADMARYVLPLFAPDDTQPSASPTSGGRTFVRPIIDREFPLGEAAAAHAYMADNRNFGKVLLRVADYDNAAPDGSGAGNGVPR